MGLCLEVAFRPKFWSGYLENNSSARPSTVIVIEAVRLCAFAPPSSPLNRHWVVFFPRSIMRASKPLEKTRREQFSCGAQARA